MVKLKIKIPLSGRESTGSAAAAGPSSQPSELKAALPKIVIKASQAKAKEENAKEVGGGREAVGGEGTPSLERPALDVRPHSADPAAEENRGRRVEKRNDFPRTQ